MSLFARFAVPALKVICPAVSIIIVSDPRGALAQNQPDKALVQVGKARQLVSVEQMPLTEKHVQGYIAATAEVHSALETSEESVDKLSPQTIVKLDAVAQKHGLSDYAEYNRIGKNIGQVTSGVDEVTRKYVGRDALIRLRIARVKANKKMSEVDRKEALTDLNDQLQFALPPVQYKGNIDLVVKYYGKLPEGYYSD